MENNNIIIFGEERFVFQSLLIKNFPPVYVEDDLFTFPRQII